MNKEKEDICYGGLKGYGKTYCEMIRLQQENNQLKEQLKGVREEREYLFNKLSFENKELHNKIDKAIDYINTTVVMGDGTKLRNTIDGERLLEILKDSDVDE